MRRLRRLRRDGPGGAVVGAGVVGGMVLGRVGVVVQRVVAGRLPLGGVVRAGGLGLAGEMTDPMRAAVRPYGVTCVDADECAHRQPYRFLHGHWWKGWQLKPYAIAHSAFREVLYLDASIQANSGAGRRLLPGALGQLPPGVLCVITSRNKTDWMGEVSGLTTWEFEKHVEELLARDSRNDDRNVQAVARIVICFHPEAFGGEYVALGCGAYCIS